MRPIRSLLIALLLLVGACGEDSTFTGGASGDLYFANYGTVLSGQGSITTRELAIRRDNGIVLVITRNNASSVPLTAGDRVIANYRITGDYEGYGAWYGGYLITLNGVIVIPCSEPLRRSAFSDEEYASLADRPIQLVDAWFGAHYLNVRYTSGAAADTRLRAVWLNDRSDEGQVELRLFIETAEGKDAGREERYACLDLTPLASLTTQRIHVTLRWRDEKEGVKESTGWYEVNP